MRATVTLIEGKSYRYKNYVFTPATQAISDPADIEYLQGIGVLKVVVTADSAPTAPKPPFRPPARPSARTPVAAPVVEPPPKSEPEQLSDQLDELGEQETEEAEAAPAPPPPPTRQSQPSSPVAPKRGPGRPPGPAKTK